MKPLIRILCALGLFAALGAPCADAQGLSRGADPEGSLVQELIVTARAPGPAWWEVSDADSTVWVMGLPAGLPKGTAWNERPMQDRLARARSLLLPAQVRIGPLRALAFFIGHRKALRTSVPLEQGLPAPVARRFAAARASLGQPAKRYAAWKPAIAGVMLDGDLRKATRLDAEQPLDRIRALARKAHVGERRVGTYDAGPVLTAVIAMSDEAQRECLDDALAEVEAGPARVSAAASGWARGDVRAALAVERGYDRCFAALPVLSTLLQRGHADMANAIAGALAQPGETVAMVDLRALLATGGVLDQLRRRGFKVETPATVGNSSESR